jgi:hypothetical protein
MTYPGGLGERVFLDESGAQANMTRLGGPWPVGRRCVDPTPHGPFRGGRRRRCSARSGARA